MSRSRRPEYLVPGERAVRELLGARPTEVHTLMIEQGRDFPEVEKIARDAGIHVRRRPAEGLAARVGEGVARGLLAIASPPREIDLEDLLENPSEHALIVALDQVVDPRNLGAIMRSAEFFGALGVVCGRDRAAPLSPAAVRASAGASERLPRCVVPNVVRALEAAKGAGFWVVGTVPEGGEPLKQAPRPERVVVVLGSEERGLRRLVRERCDLLVTIPRAGRVASLNVSAAAAVAFAHYAV